MTLRSCQHDTGNRRVSAANQDSRNGRPRARHRSGARAAPRRAASTLWLHNRVVQSAEAERKRSGNSRDIG